MQSHLKRKKCTPGKTAHLRLPLGARRCGAARLVLPPTEGLVLPGAFRELYDAAPNGLT